jgi:hypothetical protein
MYLEPSRKEERGPLKVTVDRERSRRDVGKQDSYIFIVPVAYAEEKTIEYDPICSG